MLRMFLTSSANAGFGSRSNKIGLYTLTMEILLESQTSKVWSLNILLSQNKIS